ncbi:MAG: exosome protein [Ignisphaera sp.]|nr:exosome protein [Ignisphaera sp.]
MVVHEARKVVLAEIILTTYCHATEDCNKVRQAILNIIPRDLASSISISETVMKGYYGNPIIVIEARLKEEEALKALKYMASILSELDKRYIVNSFELRYDKKTNKVFIRIDKQGAYLGKPVVAEGDDVVKITLSFSMRRSAEDVKKFLEEVFFDQAAKS